MIGLYSRFTFRPLRPVAFMLFLLMSCRLYALDIAGPLTIDNSNKATYQNQDINITTGTVTIAVSIAFNSLNINNGATITHPAGGSNYLDIAINTNATIQNGGAIDVSGRGYGSDGGPGAGGASPFNRGGGASYGGQGNYGYPDNITGGPAGLVNGSIMQPLDAGSGGGTGAGNAGHAGGGVIKLSIGGSLIVNGSLLSNGINSGAPSFGGAGSGGSIWISTSNVSGTGFITANGGSSDRYEGSGGGGRIALRYTGTNSMNRNNIQTAGGNDNWLGYASCGTVFVKAPGESQGELWINNSGFYPGYSQTLITTPQSFDKVDVWGKARLSAPAGSILDISTTSDFIIEWDGLVDSTGQGFGSDQGPGAGGASPFNRGGGASYGGQGNYGFPDNITGGPAGMVNGSIMQPLDAGSGGGTGGGDAGHAGGGVIKLSIGGSLIVNGGLLSNGINSAGNIGGAGSGGSIWISTSNVSGTGFITANGGSSDHYAGSGGGGRIALRYTGTNSMNRNNIQTAGGNDNWLGFAAAGTIFVKGPGQTQGELWINNNGSFSAYACTQLFSPATFDKVDIWNGGRLAAPTLTLLDLTVLGDMIVETGGSIDENGLGFTSGQGIGAGGGDPNRGGGGGYGGHGTQGYNGFGTSGGAGGTTYGSNLVPLDFGSGGGAGGNFPGTAGGGAVRLIVNGNLQVDGFIRSNGEFIDRTWGGAGSGGSVLVRANSISGVGYIQAQGGDSNFYAGSGGGGLIAIYYGSKTLPNSSIDPNGGKSNFGGNGGSGAPYLEQFTGVYLQNLSLSANSAPGGQTIVGGILLSAPAPSGGVTVTLTNSNPTAATVPASVTVPEGMAGATFMVTALSTLAANTTKIAAYLGGAGTNVNFTAVPWLSTLAITPASLLSGTTGTGKITLSATAPAGGIVVSLASNDTAVSVPATVTLAAGSATATFTVTVGTVTSAHFSTITGTYGVENKSTGIVLNPGAVITTLTLSPASVVGGTGSLGIVTLTAKAPVGGLLVSLSSANTLAAQSPATVMVPAGRTSASFFIRTNTVVASSPVVISAVLGSVTKPATLTIRPAGGVRSVTLIPASLVGGESSVGVIELDSVSTVPVTINVTSTSLKAIPDSTVIIPPGNLVWYFNIDTQPVTIKTYPMIAVTPVGLSKAQKLTIKP